MKKYWIWILGIAAVWYLWNKAKNTSTGIGPQTVVVGPYGQVTTGLGSTPAL